MKRFNPINYRAHPFSISDKTWSEILQDDKDYSEIVLNLFKSGYLKGDWFNYKKLSADKLFIQRE